MLPLRIGGLHLVPFTPALSKVCGYEVMIFAPSIERGRNSMCIRKLPDLLPYRQRHKSGGWKWGWLCQTIPKREVTMLMGDMNAKVGKRCSTDTYYAWGHGLR